MSGPHAEPASKVARALGVDPLTGLSGAEVGARLERFGPNTRVDVRRPRYLAIAARQLADPLSMLLVGAAALSTAIGDVGEAVAIAVIVVLNSTLGFVQELRAERAVRALRGRLDRRARVVRAGSIVELDAAGLVPGDLLSLAEGDRVEADGRLLEARGLAADESILTGESVPVDKQVDAVPADAPIAERSSIVWADTWVTRGRGLAVVTATAGSTESGRTASLVQQARPPTTPLQHRLGRLTRAAVGIGLAITVLLTGGMLARGHGWEDSLLAGVAVAVAAVPEGLAVTVTIALALGAHAMAARGAIVRRLVAVETLGETSVICTDKTGTLTENRLRVAASLPEPGVSVRRLLEAALLASTAGARRDAADRLVLPDPLDAAVLEEARGQGVDVGVLLATNELLGEVPFDPKRRRVSALYGSGDGRRLVVKGAPEVVLERSWAGAGDHGRFEGLVESLADQGVRVLAVAERRIGAGEDATADLDHDLTLLGLVGFRDPLRPAVPEAVREARSAGIDVVMITGDHPVTARAIGRSLGLPPDAIRARVDPEAKLELVTALQARGEVVAVTGDGVNDAAALRRADVGVAMGKAGTEAAREASAIVLTDDDFSTIVAAVREGRRIGDNLRKFVAFLLSANLGEVVAFTIAVLAGLGPPLTVVQVLVVNVLTDSLPAIALSRDPAAPGVMARGPDRRGQLFARRTWVALGLVSLAVGGAALAAFVIGRDGGGVATGQTMAFATLALAELALVFSVRSSELGAWREPWNGSLVLAVLGSLAVLALIMLVPALHEPFGVLDLSAAQLTVVVGLAAAPALLVEFAKALGRSRSRR